MIPARWRAATVLLSCLLGWLALHHGAIRSPDAEVQVRACRAIATTGSSAIDRELSWRGFGMATGVDGQRYALFGPLQPLLCAPLWWLGEALGAPGPRPVRPSLYADGHVMQHLRRTPPAAPHRHVMRAWISLFNVVISLLSVAAFAWLAGAIVGDAAAWATALLFGLGTLTWHYAGTFFSEPLAITCDLIALGAVLRAGGGAAVATAGDRWWWLSGAAMGLAICAHVSAALWAPFVLLIAVRRAVPGRRTAAAAGQGGATIAWRGLGLWLVGCALPLLALGAFNFARFGGVLETGRGVDPSAALRFGYGHWTDPGRGVKGLLIGASKGLLWYAPLTLLGLLSWPKLRRRRPTLAWALLGGVLVRLVFIAARSDWHGGFGLGPRLMLQAVPLLLLPLAARLDAPNPRIWAAAALLGGLAAAQQAWLQLGEPFAWFQLVRRAYAQRGVAAFADDRIYLDWDVAPLLYLHTGPPGPWWMHVARVTDSPYRWPIVVGVGIGVASLVWALRAVATPPSAYFLTRALVLGSPLREHSNSTAPAASQSPRQMGSHSHPNPTPGSVQT